MKMQNVEMEFVTFDAQDVITTSGGPTTLAARINLIRDYNTGRDVADQLFNKSSLLTGGLDPTQPVNTTKGTWWLLYDGGQGDLKDVPADNYDTYQWLRDAESAADSAMPEADVVANTVADIENWLKYNRSLQ